jgi:transposase
LLVLVHRLSIALKRPSCTFVNDVAAELGVHPRTVSRALKRGGSPPGQPPAARKSKLDRYQPVIDRLLAAGVWNAAVILREIQEQGYRGQASILRDYIRPKRPLRQGRATVRFETAPGEQLQNDWAKYRTLLAGRAQEVHFAVNTRGYSIARAARRRAARTWGA